jgi:EpsI family protein
VRKDIKMWMRFALAATVLAGAALLLHSRSGTEAVPLAEPLDLLPSQIGPWQGTSVSISRDTLEVLGSGEFLDRKYTRASNDPPVDLFIAYFPTQRSGSTMHSPQNCLPGSGWSPVDLRRVELATAGPGRLQANRYILAKGLDRLLVYYWYQEHGRAVASEYWAKFYLVADSIRMNRSDGALIRVVTPIASDKDQASADRRSEEFIRNLLPYLAKVIPN